MIATYLHMEITPILSGFSNEIIIEWFLSGGNRKRWLGTGKV